MHHRALYALLLSVALLAAGCGQESALVPVSGTVTLDGQPVSGMIITFAPQGQTDGNGALGYVDNEGKFTLTDSRGEPGAYVGQYRISFYPALMQSLREDDPEGVVAPREKVALPRIYLEPANSPVLAEVPASGGHIEVLLTANGKDATAKIASSSQ